MSSTREKALAWHLTVVGIGQWLALTVVTEAWRQAFPESASRGHQRTRTAQVGTSRQDSHVLQMTECRVAGVGVGDKYGVYRGLLVKPGSCVCVLSSESPGDPLGLGWVPSSRAVKQGKSFSNPYD